MNSHDNSGISGDSSSGTSRSSKQGTVDEYTLRLATESVKKAVAKNALPFVMMYAQFYVVDVMSLSAVMRHADASAILPFTVLLYPSAALSRGVLNSLSSATAMYTLRNISKNQLLAANVYFAHYFLLAAIYVLVAVVVYFVGLRYLATGTDFYFLLAHIVVGSVSNMLAYASCAFLTQESRFLPTTTYYLAFYIVFSLLLTSLYQNGVLTDYSLKQPSIALMCAYIVNFVIGFAVVTKLPVLNIKYAGTLKFSLKRLSPIRVKILGQILLNAPMYLLMNLTDDVAGTIIAVLTVFKFFDKTQQIVSCAQLLVYRFYAKALECVSRGIADCFFYIAGYNMGVKKIARIFEVLVFSFVCQLGLCIVLAVVLLAAYKQITALILPLSGDPHLVSLIRERITFSAYAGVWSQLLAIPVYISAAILQMEQNTLMSLLLAAPKFVFCVVFVLLQFFQNTEAAQLDLPLALSEIVSFFVGAPCLAYFLVKYHKLFRINTQTERRINTEEANNEIRASVMAELAKTADEIDDEERRDKATSRTNTIFNKQIALKGSKNFMSLRQSVGYGDSRRTSSIADDGGSIIRASQINRDSVMK